MFIKENAFENVIYVMAAISSLPQCVKKDTTYKNSVLAANLRQWKGLVRHITISGFY